MRQTWLAGFMLALLPAAAAADIFLLEGGSRIEGKILSETPSSYTLLIERQNLKARLTVRKSKVRRILRQAATSFELLRSAYRSRALSAARTRNPLLWEDLATWCRQNKLPERARTALASALLLRREATEQAGTAEAWHRLAGWCRARGFAGEARGFDRKALALDTDHAGARKALGYRRHQGAWLTAAQHRAARDRQMRLDGYVRYRGKWYTPQAATALARLQDDALKRRVAALEAALGRLERRATTAERGRADLARKLRAAEAAHRQALESLADESDREIEALRRRLRRLERHRCR